MLVWVMVINGGGNSEGVGGYDDHDDGVDTDRIHTRLML